jgi:hypothetical protein
MIGRFLLDRLNKKVSNGLVVLDYENRFYIGGIFLGRIAYIHRLLLSIFRSLPKDCSIKIHVLSSKNRDTLASEPGAFFEGTSLALEFLPV